MGLGVDLYSVPEVNRVEDNAVLVFDVDAVAANDVSDVLHRLARRETSILQGHATRLCNVEELNAIRIRHVQIVVEMEKEPRHAS